MLKNKLLQLTKQLSTDFKQVQSAEDLLSLEKRYLGRKGELQEIMKELKGLAVQEKKDIGILANKVKQDLVDFFAIQQRTWSDKKSRVNTSFDPTLPGTKILSGGLHPITQVKQQLNEAFLSLGFEIYEGPEISSELYAFDYLNFPPDHPARESMDTYWLAGSDNASGKDRMCLRPHLTGGSVRYMQIHKPPFRFVYPGRVFRSEATDAGHERTFYQYEALMVDAHIPFSSGKVMIQAILNRIFGREVKVRMRAGFFPFVEPGFEIDIECLVCGGKGCSVCKHNGWLEMMPGGPPHPNVLKAGGIDPDKWQGFYINIGLDRLVMMKYGIDDIRLFHSGDLRFLNQF